MAYEALPSNQEGQAAARYKQLETKRTPYLTRGRACAKLTLPYLLTDEGHSGSTRFMTPFNGVGPRGILGLSSKTALALLPPSQPFFRLRPDEETVNVNELSDEERAELETGLAKVESVTAAEIEAVGDRPVVVEALKHLFVVGNGLVNIGEKGSQFYGLHKFVVCRDRTGKTTEIVVKESMTREELRKQAPELAELPELASSSDSYADKNKNSIDLYTHIKLEGKRWHEYQEIAGHQVEGSEGNYPEDKSPWLPLRMIRVDGEDYGRSYVEQFLGDLKTLESLTRSLVKAAAIGAKVVFLVKPGSSTKAKTIAEADSGDIKQGNAEDVSVLQADKYNDLKTALEMSASIERRLALAFLESTTVRRDAERVTAEEIRVLVQELENALGGLYSTLTVEFQMPYVKRRMALLQNANRLPKLPDGSVRVVIVTGVEALGRGHERMRLLSWADTLKNTVGLQVVDATAFAKQLAIAEGIDWKSLLRKEEDLANEQQMGQMQALTEKLGPSAIREVGNMMNTPTGEVTSEAGSPEG